MLFIGTIKNKTKNNDLSVEVIVNTQQNWKSCANVKAHVQFI